MRSFLSSTVLQALITTYQQCVSISHTGLLLSSDHQIDLVHSYLSACQASTISMFSMTTLFTEENAGVRKVNAKGRDPSCMSMSDISVNHVVFAC